MHRPEFTPGASSGQDLRAGDPRATAGDGSRPGPACWCASQVYDRNATLGAPLLAHPERVTYQNRERPGRGNVRELRNALERAAILSGVGLIGAAKPLGLTRTQLYRRLQKYCLEKPPDA